MFQRFRRLQFRKGFIDQKMTLPVKIREFFAGSAALERLATSSLMIDYQ